MKKREMSLILDKLEWHPLPFWRPFFAVSSNALESRDETSEEVMVDLIGEFSAHLKTKQIQTWSIPQFYIQLVYKLHFGTWTLLFGPFGQLRAARKKSGCEFFWATFEGRFFNFLWAKKNLIFFWKYCIVRTKKLHKIKLIFF